MDKYDLLQQNIKDSLDILIDEAFELIFTEDFKKTTSAEKEKMEVLGIIISKYCEWDGVDIMKAFKSALTDSNFHSIASIIEDLIGLIK